MREKSLLPIERHHRRIGAAFKNKRVFLDHRGNTLILDYRGSTGHTRMDLAGLRKLSDLFEREVDGTEGGPLGHGKTQEQGIESWKGLGFLNTRAYDFDDIREDEYLTEYLLQPDEPYVDRDILQAIDKWLSDDGWKVTWK